MTLTTLKPIYTAENVNNPAYCLHYGWTGWPSVGALPDPLAGDAVQELDQLWESDGLRRVETTWTEKMVQITFSATPQVAPIFVAARAKGRLQHALRIAGTPTKFSRKVAVRSIGDNTRQQVEAYIRRQVDGEPFADARFREFLRQFTIEDPLVDLSQPTATLSGRYWYNLHVVLVTRQRARTVDAARLARLRDASIETAKKECHQLKILSLMPDHLHMALRGNIERSPEDIALAFLNNLTCAAGQNAVWQYGYYAGTFSEYDLNAVRRR